MKQARILFLIGIFTLLSLMGTISLLYSDVTLAVPEIFQEYSNWCWDASSQATLFYYNQYPSQCEIANYAWNTSRCCGGSDDFYDRVKGCNKANWLYGNDGSVQGILANWGISSTAVDDARTWSECVQDLDNGSPVVMRFGWSSGGGHMLVLFGYISTGSYLEYMDPWPGEGYTTSLYTYVASSPDHDWTHTLHSLTNN
jgi:hypothetical protein